MIALKNRRTPFWTFRAASDGAGELLIYGEISDYSWWGDEVTPRQFHDDLKALGDVSELRVYINSPGGDAFAGQAIHSMIKRHTAHKTVYIDGLAASAASVIAMAGDKIVMPRNAMMMIHNPWTFAMGEAADFRKMADTLDQVRETLVAAYEAKTGMEPDRIRELLDAETWMTAEEAVDMGFADEIEEAKQVAASMKGRTLVINGQGIDLTRFRNPPKIVTLEPQNEEPPNEAATDDQLRLLTLELELLTEGR